MKLRSIWASHPLIATESDQMLLDTLWERLWDFADTHYVEEGRGAIILQLTGEEVYMGYTTLSIHSEHYVRIVEQIEAYEPHTECIVLLLGGISQESARLYRLYRLALAA